MSPATGRPVMQEVIEGLTGTLVVPETAGDTRFERSTPRLVAPATEERLHALFQENRWTDQLPIVLPTEARVAEMLAHTQRAPDEVVGRMQPTANRGLWEYTVEKVAVNAVMAGARPEYFPVILAVAASGVSARGSTSSSGAAMAVINGPIRAEIGMNCGIGAMGPYNHANATIGRAYGLLSQNLQGGSVIGETYMGSQGNVWNYAATFPENEERSPWEPLHLQRGYKPTDSTVTVYLGGWYTLSAYGPRETWQERFRHMLAACEPFSAPMLVMDPIVAHDFVKLGFGSKQKLIDWCAENSRVPAREYWDDPWVQTLIKPHAVAGVEPWATMLRAAPDEMIAKYRAEDISIVVVGGETQGGLRMISGSFSRARTVSVDDWR
jgi:hypothetical protein